MPQRSRPGARTTATPALAPPLASTITRPSPSIRTATISRPSASSPPEAGSALFARLQPLAGGLDDRRSSAAAAAWPAIELDPEDPLQGVRVEDLFRRR